VAGFCKMIVLTGEQIAGLLVRVTANRVDASVGTLAIVESLPCIPAPSSCLIGIPSHDGYDSPTNWRTTLLAVYAP
jgi:hypothetical protein